MPLPSAETAIDTLNTDYCDIAMTQFPVIPSVALRVDLTIPFKKATAAVILHDYRRDDFATWKQIRDHGEIRVGIYAFDFAERLLLREVPKAKVVPLQNAPEQKKLLDANLEGVDVILNAAEEAAAWTILYPRYSVVIPRPVKSFPVSYAVPRGSIVMLKVVNAWLSLAKADGTIARLYDYWVQGKIGQVRPRRWSVIRNVLHWVD